MKKNKNKISYTMDDLKNDKRSERITGLHSIYTQATGVFVMIILGYSSLVFMNVLGKNGMIRQRIGAAEGSVFGDIVDLVFENVILAGLFFAIFVITRTIYQRIWIKKHKTIWLKGYWLHVHEKEDGELRIGYVRITQSFDDINAEATNVDARDPVARNKKTTWSYYTARVDEEYLRGFYNAVKGNAVENPGMHYLKIEPPVNDFPTELKGTFSDVSAKVKEDKSVEQHNGTLTLYRATTKQIRFLFEDGEFKPEKLPDFLKSKKFEDDPFVIHVRQFLEKNPKRTETN